MRFQAFSRFVWTSVSGVFHDHEAKKAFSFAATSRMAVLVCPGEISVVGQNLTSILQNIFVGKETFWGVHSANLAG